MSISLTVNNVPEGDETFGGDPYKEQINDPKIKNFKRKPKKEYYDFLNKIIRTEKKFL